MSFVLTLILLFATPFESSVDRAFNGIQNNDWTTAAAALDEAYADQPSMFAANNLHYLRGRVAESQGDWRRAREAFSQIAKDNPLYAVATWRAARASAKLNDERSAEDLIGLLPQNFPAELRIQLARESDAGLASKIYQNLSTREARYQRARMVNDIAALRTMIHENRDDDVALDSARIVAPMAATAADQMEAGEAFASHREFNDALPLFERAATDAAHAADARFKIARVHFQQEHYQLALDDFRALAKDFPGSDWEKEAEYQIPSCHWRLGDYRSAEQAYLSYIKKYPKGMREAATRNLIDVYRVLGENQKAVATLDRALAAQLSVSTRQVFLFTKAKILYVQKRYAAALAIFQQLGRMKLRSAPGSATSDEIDYFQALCQSKLGNNAAAKTLWRKLARDAFSYYGQRAAEKLNDGPSRTSESVCLADSGAVAKTIEADVDGLRRPVRDQLDSTGSLLSELLFLRLWDEAAFWMNRSEGQLARRQAAEIAYLGGQFGRTISLADRLPRTQSNLPLLYPAGFRKLICDAAAAHKVDPLWLHAIIWQESKYDPSSRSGAGARGLMQFIPETARAVAASIGKPVISIEKLYEPSVSVDLGAAYWSDLIQKMKTPEVALAAYNGGPDNAARWVSKSDDPELFVADIGFVETKKYVMLVFAARAAYGSLVN